MRYVDKLAMRYVGDAPYHVSHSLAYRMARLEIRDRWVLRYWHKMSLAQKLYWWARS